MIRASAALISALLLSAPATAQVRVGMAAATFPESWGNPFASTSVTRLPLQAAIFDPLTFVSSDGKLNPWLAETWVETAPGVLRITLRPDVVFSNGEPLDASAVVASITYLASEAGRREAVSRELADLKAARVIDARTVELQTARPDPLLPFRLSLIMPVPPKAWAAAGRDAFARAPVGTGPLKLTSLAPNRGRLEKSATSWRKVSFDILDYLVLPDPATRRAALSSGEADIAPTTVTPDQFADIEAIGGRVVPDRIPAVVGVVFNTVKESPLRDAKVRQALTHAVNRQLIVDSLFAGMTKVAAQPAPHGSFGFNAALQPLSYDLEKARALLREAGYPNGFSFVMEVPVGAASFADVFQQVAADLARVGVNMETRAIPQQVLFQRVQAGGWSGEASAIPMFTPVFDALYPMRQHSCMWTAPWFCDQAAMPAIEAAFAAPDLATRRKLTEDVMARAHDAAQALYLYDTVAFIALGPRIEQFQSDFSFIRYEAIRLKAAN